MSKSKERSKKVVVGGAGVVTKTEIWTNESEITTRYLEDVEEVTGKVGVDDEG